MASTSANLVEALARVPELLDGALRSADRDGRAARLAEALRSLWPGAELYACRLGEGATAALGTNSEPLPHGTAALEAADSTLLIAPLACAGRPHGLLALAPPQDTPEAERTTAHALLAVCADHLRLRLHAEELQGRVAAAEQELKEQTASGDVAEAFGVFLHELGNVLNTLVLDVRLLERHVPEAAHGLLAEISRLAGSVPHLLGHLNRYRQSRRPATHAVDLNRVASRVLEVLGVTGQVRAELEPDLPRVAGAPGALSRLVRLLLANALAVTPATAGPVALRTARHGEQVRLCVEDGGPPVPVEDLLRLFEPFVTLRPGQDHLELAVCKMLVRRLQGTLDAVNRPEGGLAFFADLPISLDEPGA